MAAEHHRLAVMQRGWAGWDTFSYAVARVKAQLVAEDDEAAALRQENQELQVRHSQPTHRDRDVSGSRGRSLTHRCCVAISFQEELEQERAAMEAEIDQEREEIEQMYEEERAEEQEKMREVGMARIRREACRRAFAAFRDAVEVKEWEENIEWEPLFVRRVEWSQMSCAFLRWVAWRREEAAKSER